MTDRLDLPLRYREQLEALLRAHVPDAEVWAYGSRVNGRSHDGSDLDLVLRSPTLKPLGGEYLYFSEALHRSNIPVLSSSALQRAVRALRKTRYSAAWDY